MLVNTCRNAGSESFVSVSESDILEGDAERFHEMLFVVESDQGTSCLFGNGNE